MFKRNRKSEIGELLVVEELERRLPAGAADYGVAWKFFPAFQAHEVLFEGLELIAVDVHARGDGVPKVIVVNQAVWAVLPEEATLLSTLPEQACYTDAVSYPSLSKPFDLSRPW